MCILLTGFHKIFYDPYWENFFKHTEILSLVIISFILTRTCTFDHAVILYEKLDTGHC